MALAATTIVEVEHGGSDTANGGTFDPGRTFTADGAISSANTASPVLSSASYNFVAGDVGAWVFLKSGSNLIPGWYQIASVGGNNATLSAAIGSAILYGTNGFATGFNTVAGCSSSGSSLSSISWGVDYSQQSAAQYAPTTYTSPSSSAGTTMNWSGAAKNMIGNGLVIPSGVTNATAGYYTIVSVVAATSVTLDRNWNSGSVTTGGAAIGIGGALASPGQAGSIATVGGMTVFIRYSASVYSLTTASTNVSGGCISGAGSTMYVGYNTQRWPFNADTSLPTLQIAASVSSATILAGNATANITNVILDGNSQTSSRGVNTQGTNYACTGKNFTNGAFTTGGSSNSKAIYCVVTGCSSVVPISTTYAINCEAYANTVTPFNSGTCIGCLSYGNTGAATDGFAATVVAYGCVAYNNGRYDFNQATAALSVSINCVAENASTYGFFNGTGGGAGFGALIACASYANVSGRFNGAAGHVLMDINPITEAASGFVNAGSNNFAPASPGALIAAAFPATFPTGTTANYEDVGAAQHQATGGTAGGAYYGG